MLMLAVSRQLIRQHANVSGGRWRGNKAPRSTRSSAARSASSACGHHRQEDRAARQGVRHGGHLLRHPAPDEAEEDALGVRFRLMRELLHTSDLVSLHVPLNATTRGLIAPTSSS